jgi:hypothetical protein
MNYSFANRDGTFFQETGSDNVVVVNPTSGSTVAAAVNTQYLYVANTGTLAALTVKLPPNPQPGDRFEISFGAAVTALTLQDAAANAITGAPTAGAAGTAITLRFVNGAWVKWR